MRNPALRGHNIQLGNKHGLPKSVQQTQDDLTVLISEQGSTHRLTQHFLNKQGSFHSSPTQASCLGNVHTGFLRVRHRLHAHWTGLYMDSSGQHQLSFLYPNYASVSCRLASLDPPQDRQIEWVRTPPSRLTSSLLFACTKADTCHPWNCMRSTA